MKLEDLKRYCVYVDYYGNETVEEIDEHGKWYLYSEVQALDAAHKQREAELLAQVEEWKKVAQNNHDACVAAEEDADTLRIDAGRYLYLRNSEPNVYKEYNVRDNDFIMLCGTSLDRAIDATKKGQS